MRFSRQSRFLVALLALCNIGGSCDDPYYSSSSTPCDANIAQIAVWDGQLQVICGCGGTDGAFVPRGSNLSCTITSGKTLFVYFYGMLRHQLVSVGTPALGDSPIYDPSDGNPIRAFTFRPTAAGAYGFRDQFDGALIGTVTVTP